MADTPASTSIAGEDAAAATSPPVRPADPWLQEIDDALQREDTWRKRGKKVVQRFRDERKEATGGATSSKINILWANTEVLKAALYTRTPAPDVRRRFTDARKGDALARIAAEVTERSVAYVNDTHDVDGQFEAAIEDTLLPGRGTTWVVYEPEIEGDGEDARIVEQKLRTEFVYWEDVCHGAARVWERIPWWARRHALRPDEFRKKFPDAEKAPSADYVLKDASGTDSTKTDEKFVEVWEVWNKVARERLYVARGFANVLHPTEDPYRLAGFFPLPKPLYSVRTTDRLIPEPEFCQYQDQAQELDDVSSRIRNLTAALIVKGIYDASIDGENKLAQLAAAADNEFIPYTNWSALQQKGGIEQAFGFWPIDRIIAVLAQLYPRMQSLVQEIYQITGISDIIRGSTDPRETKGAQTLKAQFGSMRMQRRQRDVQRFIRDDYRLKAEIIAEHFTQETLAAITGMDLPTRAEQEAIKAQIAQQQAAAQAAAQQQAAMMPPGGQGAPGPMPQPPEPPAEMVERATGPTWDDVIDLLRSDRLRSYRVDVETDTTAFEDAEAAKGARIELVTAVRELIKDTFTTAATAPGAIRLVREVVMFAIRSFKAGRALEEAFEDAFDELEKNPPQPPQEDQPAPSPEKPDLKGIAAVKDVERKAQRDAAEIGLKQRSQAVDAAETLAGTRREDAVAAADIKATLAKVVAPLAGAFDA